MIEVKESLRLFSLRQLPTLKSLKNRYRVLIKRFHPDHNPGNPFWSNDLVQRLNRAYDILKAFLESHDLGSHRERIIREIIRGGDEAVRNAIIMGWLRKLPRPGERRYFREKIAKCRGYLLHISEDGAGSELSVFYRRLFHIFLEITEGRTTRVGPQTWGSFRYLKQLAVANRYLDLGLRSFYHYTGDSRELVIPLSFVEDALAFYRFLLPHTTDLNRQIIEPRMALARLYRIRALTPSLAIS
jgi:curved DNA-binding protein CbpA